MIIAPAVKKSQLNHYIVGTSDGNVNLYHELFEIV